VHPQRSKHFDIQYHFISDHCNQGTVSVEYKPSSDMIADIFTKPVARHILNQFNNFLFDK